MSALERILPRRQTARAATNPSPGNVPDGVHVGSDELIGLRLRARNFPLERRRQARSVVAGAHTSRFRGRGMDYQESRNYQPGDDIRSMDWRVTARSGQAHVKLYREERERPVVLMLDLGPGMFFATRGSFKSVIAARTAALLGWAAVANGDRIGALLFNGRHRELRPLGGQRGVLRLIRELIMVTDPVQGMTTPANTNHLNEALLRLRRVARPGSLIFILSDFYAIDADTRRHLQRLRQHNDVVACQIVDDLERNAPPPGRYAMTDGMRRGVFDTRTSMRRRAYTRYFADHHRRVRELLQDCAIPLLRLATTDDVEQRLRSFLANSEVGNSPCSESAA